MAEFEIGQWIKCGAIEGEITFIGEQLVGITDASGNSYLKHKTLISALLTVTEADELAALREQLAAVTQERDAAIVYAHEVRRYLKRANDRLLDLSMQTNDKRGHDIVDAVQEAIYRWDNPEAVNL